MGRRLTKFFSDIFLVRRFSIAMVFFFYAFRFVHFFISISCVFYWTYTHTSLKCTRGLTFAEVQFQKFFFSRRVFCDKRPFRYVLRWVLSLARNANERIFELVLCFRITIEQYFHNGKVRFIPNNIIFMFECFFNKKTNMWSVWIRLVFFHSVKLYSYTRTCPRPYTQCDP